MSNLFRDPNWDPSGSGSSYLRADRFPCPVCGHPTGDCAGDSVKPTIVFGTPNQKISSLSGSQKVLVEEDIYQERQISSHASMKVRIARKGSYVTLERALELGIIKD